MSWFDLGNPRPLSTPALYTPIVWPDGEVIALPGWEPSNRDDPSFITLVARRRTRRNFGRLENRQLGTLLDLTCRVQQIGEDALGFPITRRPVPSAGAIHPIHILLISPDVDAWYRYDAFEHALKKVAARVSPRDARSAMQAVLPAPNATLIMLAAEVGKTSAKYADPASLIWRDAGVLLGFLSMAAEALDLSFCPLGVTGEPWIGRLLDPSGLAGVGVAFAGSTSR